MDFILSTQINLSLKILKFNNVQQSIYFKIYFNRLFGIV